MQEMSEMRVRSLSWEHHLEEGMDRGAWQATGFIGLKSQTGLKHLIEEMLYF